MKNKCTLLTLLLFFQIKGFSQVCVPNTDIGLAYIHPFKLPFAMAGYPYSQVLTFRVPKDSLINYNGFDVLAVIDSARLLFMGGVPPGYQYTCNTNMCTWAGGSLGCALLEGNSDSAGTAVGDYPIKLYVGTYFKVGTTPIFRIDSSSNYTFRVLPFNGGTELLPYKALDVFPNPAHHVLHISVLQQGLSPMQLEVYDLNGRVIYQTECTKTQGERITVSTDTWNTGCYLIILKSDAGIQQQRVIIE